MTHHSNLDLIRIVLQSDCQCDVCSSFLESLFSDEQEENLQARALKLKFLVKKKIITNANCTNENCKKVMK